MVTPMMNSARMAEFRRNNMKYTPVGMSIVSPSESVSPMDSKMTPIRRSLFQKRRVTSSKRRNQLRTARSEDTRDDASVIENLRSANKKKDGHLKMLHDRFNHIQKGLGSIDEERTQLVEKAKKLDKEKKLIQKQLELREHEILALIKRCASQEERIRESAKLRSRNRGLQNDLEVMAKKIESIEEETQDRQKLKKLLEDSEIQREQLRGRLAKVQKEHDSIADTLQQCLGSIRQLTEEKHAIEEEHRRERRQAELELEKQHLAYERDSNSLKANIQEHKSRILQMESILQDKIKSNTDLRREKAIMSEGQHKEIQDVVEKYEEQLKKLQNEIEETMIESEDTHDASQNSEEAVSLMKEKLKSKDDMIEKLEVEFSDQMSKLMSKQSSLDEAEEERRELELKVEASKKLEVKHAALLDFVEILDSNLAELTTANAHLELEKEALSEETEVLRRKANMLEKQFSNLRNNHNAKENDFRELLNGEKEELREELQESLRLSRSEIVSLQDELQKRNEWIFQLENDLNQSRNALTDKENEIVKILRDMENLRSSLGADLRKARLEAAQFEAEVYAKNQTLASLEGRIDGAKAIREKECAVNSEKGPSDTDMLEKKIEVLHDHLQSTENDSTKYHAELEMTIQAVRNEAMFMQRKIDSLSEEKLSIEKEVQASRGLINDRDEQIIEVQQMILTHKKRSQELERMLQSKTKELQEYKENSEVQSDVEKHNQLEERIRVLEKEILEARVSQSESAANLEKARKTIEKLEKQLIGEDTSTKSLRKQLDVAANELSEQKTFVSNMQNQFDSTTQLQIERENLTEETRSKISLMEGKIKEMERQSNDLIIEIDEVKNENIEKDKLISSLKFDLAEDQGEMKELRSQLDVKCTQIESLEVSMTHKAENFQSEIDSLNVLLKSKEDRIAELDNLVSSNKDDAKNLRDSLAKAKEDITQLEDRICRETEEKMILLNQLREAQAKSTGTDFLPSSDSSDLKQKIQGLLTRQAELTTELDKSNATLKEERESRISKEDQSYKELSIQKAQLLVLQNVLKERERLISSLQNDEKGDQNQNMIADSRLADANDTISNLKDQLKTSERKINDLERHVKNNKVNGIQYAFVESNTGRLEAEDELHEAIKDIEELTLSATIREKKLSKTVKALEEARDEVKEKSENISSLEKRWKASEEKAQKLNDELQGDKEQHLKLQCELKSTRADLKSKEDIIKNFGQSTQSLKEVAQKASDEIERKNDIVVDLKKTIDQLNLEIEKAKNECAVKDDNLKSLGYSLKAEKDSRINLEEEVSVMRGRLSESEKMNEDLKEELEKNQSEQISSLENKDDERGRDDTNSLKESVESLKAANYDLESRLKILVKGVNQRDLTIEKLNQALLQDKEDETEIRKQRDALQKAESETRNELEDLKVEYKDAVARDKELVNIKLRNQESLHKEELETALCELESTFQKLNDSEKLLAERTCRLGKMTDHNRDIELELEKEQTERQTIEKKFVQEQKNLREVTTDLKKLQGELRRKENYLESKLKEEQNQKEYAEESLRIARNKYKDAIKTKRNVTELERENKELKDKISRQEAYLQRKLQKEKADRQRLTPSKSPGKKALGTPTTPNQRKAKSSPKELSQLSKFSRSRLQAPSSIGRGISTGIPPVSKSRSKISPTAASYRSLRTERSTFSKSTQFETPSKVSSTLSPRDILQSELGIDDDESAASELSSVLRSPPKAVLSPCSKNTEIELELQEQ